MRYYCTYFDKGYLARGLALHESLVRHEHQAFTLFVVCLDEITRLILEELVLPGVVAVPLHRLESGDRGLQYARNSRSRKEYYWSLTPTVLLRLLEWHSHIGSITYLDADLYFFSSPQPVFDEFDGSSILIHEHRFHKEFLPALRYGRYNVGLLCFRNDVKGLTVLKWWRERCNEWCYAQYVDGKFGDQLYLEDWPVRFKGVRVLEHIGAGVAPWNCVQYRFSQGDDGQVLVDDRLLIFYHFHALVIMNPDHVVLSRLQRHKFSLQLGLLCYLPYTRALKRAAERVDAVVAGLSFSIYSEQIDTEHAAIVANNLCSQLAGLRMDGAAPSFIRLDDDYSLLSTGQILADPALATA